MAFKTNLTPLADVEFLDGVSLECLRRLNITTVEELVGQLQADPAGVAQLLHVSRPQLARLRRRALATDSEAVASFLEADLDFGGLASGAVMRVGRELAGAQEPAESLLPLGALPPEGIEVEEWASVETFAAYAVRIVGEAPSGPALVAGAAQAEAEPSSCFVKLSDPIPPTATSRGVTRSRSRRSPSLERQL